ncbi:MAG: ComF family protein [Gemmatimonadetes bacterium]|nr:ComF family protein [Gemmatimonadota bacterium]
MITTLLRGLADLALPRACLVCDRQVVSGFLCDVCWLQLPALPSPRCDRCGQPRHGDQCRLCERLPPYVRAARSVCWVPEGVGGAAVHALKYDEWHGIAEAMADRMSRLAWPADVVAERTAVVPVPLGRVRLRERGYNQAELLARHVAARWRLPLWTDLVVRVRETRTQVRLTQSQRSMNVHAAFSVPETRRAPLVGAHVIVVDDVLTTGATLNAVGAALFAAGARIISYATFGRAKTPADT